MADEPVTATEPTPAAAPTETIAPTAPEATAAEPVEAPASNLPAAVAETDANKLVQTVEMRDIGPCKKHIKVTIDREAIEEKLDEKYSELVADANVAGFRPGKAPRRIIERRYRKEVGDQVRTEVLYQSLEQLSKDHDLAALSAPNIDPSKIVLPDQGPMIYEFDVEVRPDFELPDYKGLTIRRPVRTFTEADVDREEHRLLEPYGQVVPKQPSAEGGVATVELGDVVIADVVTQHAGQVLSEIKETKVRVEPQLAFKDAVATRLGEQLHGARIGDWRTVDLTLSETSSIQALRGKTVQATFTIKDLKTVILPEKTHELMHEFGVHSAEELRELLKVVLERRLQYEQRQAARQQIMATITPAATWDLPQDLLQRQARKALGRRVMEMRGAGISEDEIKGRSRLLQQDVLQSTAAGLKEHFVLQKIAETEKIDINEDDLADEIERIAARTNDSPRRVRARLEKEDMLEALAAELIERKAVDRILEHARFEDYHVDASAQAALATMEEQAVPGEMHDPMAPPAETPPPAQD